MLPLAELHCHLEGTVAPELALRLGHRHGLDLAPLVDADGCYRWRDFAEFLHVYDAMSAAIRTAEDYYEITADYYRRMAAKGMIYGEVFVSPEHGMRAGLSYSTLIEAIATAMADVEAETGVVARIVITCVRHFGREHAEETAHLAAQFPHPYVVGFGMAGDESMGAPADYARAFAIAADAGLGLTAHAGELCGPESVRATIESLPVSRIGHGVRAIEDAELVAELVDRGITLEVCPGSNLALGLYPSIAAHPVRRLHDAGVRVTLSADDPPFFDTDVAREYEQVRDAHGFDPADMLGMTRRSIEAAFLDSATRDRLLGRLDKADRIETGRRGML
ncbi:MAG: adenosine deaminase [Alphaproteobacteria bacterium]|nr:MAG: adenosine deaminase [Alphaproteobacteria bacterium]